MAKKSGKDSEKQQKDQNGKHVNGDDAASLSSSSSSSSSGTMLSFLPALLIASLAITLGILTPAVFLPSSSDHRYLSSDSESFSSASSATTAPSPLFPCTKEVLQDYWHEQPVRGLHIACLEKSSGDNDENDEMLDLTLYKNGMESWRLHFPGIKATVEWAELRDLMQNELGLPPPHAADYNFQPWATFSPVGHRLLDGADDRGGIDTLTQYGTFLIFEGGQWLWPGVHVGFKRQVNLYTVMPINSPTFDNDQARNITIETLSLSPLVVSVQGFLSSDECEYIQETATPSMAYSEVVLMDKDKGKPASDFRTSQSTFLSSKKHQRLTDIDHRTASLTRIPWAHQEHVQVLRYGLNEKYDSHTDFFDPSLYKNDPGTLQTIGHGRRNRLATVFWYLSTVEQGGETAFPRHNGAEPRSMQECSGLLVKPEKGKVIIFYSLYMDGGMDDHSLHAACPVKQGTCYDLYRAPTLAALERFDDELFPFSLKRHPLLPFLVSINSLVHRNKMGCQ
jgi:prolyl 4-hydroxylase